MTRDEAQKLLGGYATGSLTEAERKALFDAAMDDQELFDELAAEQALKELIEEPGARARLVAALEPQKPQRAWWPWAAAVAVASLATIGVWLAQRPAPQEQIALNAEPEIQLNVLPTVPLPKSAAPAPVAAPPAAEASSAPAAVPEPKAKTEVAATGGFAAPVAPPPAIEEPLAIPNQLEARKQALPTVLNPQVGALAATARSNFAADAASPLGFEFLANGNMRVTAHFSGLLEVRSGQTVLFDRKTVAPETPVDVTLPDGTQQVRIEFTIGTQPPTVINAPVPR